jgi:hypothetical protein
LKKLTYILISLFAFGKFGNVSAQCASAVNIFTFSGTTSNYELVKEAKTWTAAAACASQRGGYLVEINNQAEQTLVYNGIISSSVASNYSPVGDGGGASYMWIGGNDKVTEGDWFWDGNNDLVGTKFWTGQGAAGANNGTAFGGAFVNWGGKSTTTIKEPDNFNSNQDAAAIALMQWPYGIAGEWNDIAETNAIYYIIEIPLSTNLNSTTDQENAISVYPNPAKDKVELSSDIEFKKITITSIDGKVLKTFSSTQKNQTIDISTLSKGIYFINITTVTDKLITKKIVKD